MDPGHPVHLTDHITSLSLHVPAQPPASRDQQPRCHLPEGHRETPPETQAGDACSMGSSRLRRPQLRMGNLAPPPFPPSASGRRTPPLSHPPTCSGEQPLRPLCHSPPHSSELALKAHPCFATLASLWAALEGESRGWTAIPGKPSLPPLPPTQLLPWLGLAALAECLPPP